VVAVLVLTEAEPRRAAATTRTVTWRHVEGNTVWRTWRHADLCERKDDAVLGKFPEHRVLSVATDAEVKGMLSERAFIRG
jgi:hypothetical protein